MLLSLLLVACGPDPATFALEYSEVVCGAVPVECYGSPDWDGDFCRAATFRAAVVDLAACGDDYDPAAAADCLDEIEANYDCEDVGRSLEEIAPSCREVCPAT